MRKWILVVIIVFLALSLILLAWHTGILHIIVTENQFWAALEWLTGSILVILGADLYQKLRRSS